ncbi:MAG: ABC transporter ATP-binding protein, partial [Bacteroidota bacterium]|nr:ABC transporter ATP-binding protein [Bacteroidota bacterium]
MAVIASVLLGIFSTSRPLLIQHAFDNYILFDNSSGFLNIIILIFVCILFESGLQFYFIFQSNFLAQTIIKKIRVRIFSKLINFPVSFFDKSPTGQLITRVVSDIEAISSVFSQGLLVVFGDTFKMILVVICMFFISWQLALISLICLPILIISTSIFQKYMKKAFIDVRKYISKINVFVFENIIGMSIIQLFAKEQVVFEKFKILNSHHRDSHIKTVLYFSIFLPIVDVCSAIAMGLIVWYGSINIITVNTISVGDMIAFILLINMLYRPLRSIADKFNVLQMGIVASSRVFEIINTSITVDEITDFKTIKTISNGKISFDNVKFYYKKNENVLNGLSFDIEKNKTLAIVGPTGSGKTTIINLFMRWYQIQSGSIKIDEINIENYDTTELRKNIGVVLQDSFFLSDTLMNNIKFYRKIDDNTVYKAVKKIGLESFINKFPDNYNYMIGERGAGLSVGEKQLISFLRTYIT